MNAAFMLAFMLVSVSSEDTGDELPGVEFGEAAGESLEGKTTVPGLSGYFTFFNRNGIFALQSCSIVRG
jgi:hypothetical protein